MSATITIDPAKHNNRPGVLRTLRHEMIHVVLGETELMKVVAHQPICTEEGKNIFDVAFSHALEKSVTAVELAFDAVGMTPEKLVREGNKLISQWDSKSKPVKKAPKKGVGRGESQAGYCSS